jgi:hypothetical protein
MEIFTDDFLKEIGFTLTKRENSKFKPYQEYGEAKDRTGMTIIYWNNQGASCTYFGDKLKDNVYFTIEKDGGTRTVFNGYAFSAKDVKKILKLTW